MFQKVPFIFIFILFCFASISARAEEKLNSPLSLEEVVVNVFEKNPELKSLHKEVEATKAKVPQVRSWEDTQIGVRFFEVPFNAGIGSAEDIDYIVSQKIPFPGKKNAAAKVVYHEYLHHLELAGKRGREFLKEVKSTYYTLFSIHHRIKINENMESILKQLIQTAQSQVAANQASSFEAIQAQTELAKILTGRELLLQN